MSASEIQQEQNQESNRSHTAHNLQEQRISSMHADRLRSLGEMAKGIAHEINQPLAGVRAFAEHLYIGLQRNWTFSEDEVRLIMARIIDQVERITSIVEHVRSFARESGSEDVYPVHINDVINSACRLVREEFKNHEIHIEIALQGDLPNIIANPFSLEEVIIHLLSNSKDAIEEKRKNSSEDTSLAQIEIRSSHFLELGQPNVKVEVIDHGGGMSQTVRQKAFTPFFTTKEPDKGMGIGLAISKSLVESSGGTIDISSNSEGTRVTILLPCTDQRREEVSCHEPNKVPQS